MGDDGGTDAADGVGSRADPEDGDRSRVGPADADGSAPRRSLRTVAGLLVVLAAVGTVAWLGPGVADALTGHGEWNEAPTGVFGYEYDRASNGLTLRHLGGDHYTSENTDRLVVVVTTPDGETETHPVALPFEPCDAVRVTVPPGSSVEIVWRGPTLDRPLTPASFEVPDRPRTTRTGVGCSAAGTPDTTWVNPDSTGIGLSSDRGK